MKQVIRLAGGKRRELSLSAALAALGSILTIVPYALIYRLIRYYIDTESAAWSAEVPVTLLLWALGAIALRYILTVLSFLFSHIAAFDLLYRIRSRLTAHLGRLPMGYWSYRNTGHVRKVIQEDVELIENSIAHHIPDFISGIVVPVVTLGYLYTVDWRMAAAATVPLAGGLLLVNLMYRGYSVVRGESGGRKELMKLYHDSLEDMHSRTVEYVKGMPVVKVFNLTVESFEKLRNAVLRYGELVEKWSRGGTPFWAGFTALVLGGGVFILPVALHLLSTGQTDAAEVVLFLLLGTGCFSGMVNFIKMTSSVMMINEGAGRIAAILDSPVMEEPEEPMEPADCSIEIIDAGFTYAPDRPEAVLEVDMTIPEGSFIALVGPSGAGKSTLAQLMARVWDVTTGSIEIGGRDLRDLGSAQVSRLTGTVFQDVQILTATVADNIRMGDSGKTIDDVREAAKTAAVHDLIETLPRGYETVIGEGGEVHLSGGEQQRIALARVILRNPPIIILDEATAYADAENQDRMQEAFARATRGRTVIVVAHRLSTIVRADAIHVMDRGRIVQSGTHEELLQEKNGLYSRMWEAHIRAGRWSFRGKMKEREVAV